MSWLGVRCWRDKIALVAVHDADTGPEVTFQRRQPVPETTDPGERTGWFAKVVLEAINESRCTGVSVRIADSNPVQERAEAEGAVLAAAHENGVPTARYRRQSLTRPLGIDRAQGAWATFQRRDPFIGALVGDEKDAAMAALGAARS